MELKALYKQLPLDEVAMSIVVHDNDWMGKGKTQEVFTKWHAVLSIVFALTTGGARSDKYGLEVSCNEDLLYKRYVQLYNDVYMNSGM